jgi:hypothetical protein
MELSKIAEIFEKLKKMFKDNSEDNFKELVAEEYDKNSICGGFFFDADASMCKSQVAKYHVVIMKQQNDKGECLVFIVNGVDSKPKKLAPPKSQTTLIE